MGHWYPCFGLLLKFESLVCIFFLLAHNGFLRFTFVATSANCTVVALADISTSIGGAHTHDRACGSTTLLTIRPSGSAKIIFSWCVKISNSLPKGFSISMIKFPFKIVLYFLNDMGTWCQRNLTSLCLCTAQGTLRFSIIVYSFSD